MSEIDWALLARYVGGDCGAEERALVERRLADEPRFHAALDAFNQVTAQSRMEVSVEERDERAGRFYARIQLSKSRREPDRRKWSSIVKIAATILLALGGSVAGYVRLHRTAGSASAGVAAHTVATPRGQRMSLSLSDGTKVVLAPASVLRFPVTYGARDRTVELDGEAEFTVVHDARRPFIVRGALFSAEDLGTRFVVRAYRQDGSAEIAVAEGKVAATGSRSTGERTILLPGDVGRIIADSGLTVSRRVSVESYFGWTEGRLTFQRTLLRDAAARLGRWYDIDIRLASNDLGERRFSAAFREHQTGPEILGSIATALRIDLEQTGPRAYTLRASSPSAGR